MFYDPQLPQTSWRKQLVDQSAHLAAAFYIIGLFMLFPGYTGAFLTGICMGAIREITQHPKINFHKWVILDLFFWGVGGMFAYGVFK